MSKLNFKMLSRYFLIFVSGGLFVSLFQVNSLNATTVQPSGSCILLGNYSSWGWGVTVGSSKEYSELAVINFDLGTYSTIINKVTATANSEPNYTEGAVKKGTFSLQSGPISGTYKLMVGSPNDYAIIAPVNGGNSIFFLDSVVGMSGVCQKI